jgi:hypothetical protein
MRWIPNDPRDSKLGGLLLALGNLVIGALIGLVLWLLSIDPNIILWHR